MISAHLRRSRAISQSRVASTPLAERLVRVRYGEIRGDIGEISGDIGRYRGDIGVMGRYGEMRGDMGRSPRARRSRVGSRYGEIWGDTAVPQKVVPNGDWFMSPSSPSLRRFANSAGGQSTGELSRVFARGMRGMNALLRLVVFNIGFN